MGIFLSFLFVVICVLLVLVVLLQRGKGGGLGAAFGGGGGSAFGTRTGDVFTWVTIVLTGLFLLLAVVTNLYFRPKPSTVGDVEISPPAKAISEDLSVTMFTRTAGAAIYYTIDGKEPTEQDRPYEAAIKVKPGTTVRAKAFRAGWKPSPVTEAYYGKVQEAPPVAATGPSDAAAAGEPTSEPATAPADEGVQDAAAPVETAPAATAD